MANGQHADGAHGKPCPPTPADHDTYVRLGLPWFAVYDELLGDVPVDPRRAGVRTVRALAGPKPGDIVCELCDPRLGGCPLERVYARE